MNRPSLKKSFLILAVLALLAVVGVLVLRSFLVSTSPPPSAPVGTEPGLGQLREVTLYFGSDDASRLVAEARELEGCQEEDACLHAVIRALIAGPASGLVPVLPTQTRLLGVGVEGSLALIDFSQDLIQSHPGGSTSELLTVYALADTVAVNFPHIRQIRVLVEGGPVDTLKGHVDLRQPITADFGLARSPEPAAAGAIGRDE
jgi:spore germination protein GerM